MFVNRRLVAVASIAIYNCVPALALSQVGASYTSLEAMVAGAESVFVGTIQRVSRDVRIQKVGNVDYTFEVLVSEVLKGSQVARITLGKETIAFDKRSEEWRDAKSEFLWFRNTKVAGNFTDFGQDWVNIRLSEPVPGEQVFKIHAPPIFTMGFQVLKNRDEIVSKARDAVKMFERSNRKPIEMVDVTIPRAVAQKCRPSGDFNSFTVPLVADMEPIALKMITTPEMLDKDFGHPDFQPELLMLSGLKILGRLNRADDQRK